MSKDNTNLNDFMLAGRPYSPREVVDSEVSTRFAARGKVRTLIELDPEAFAAFGMAFWDRVVSVPGMEYARGEMPRDVFGKLYALLNIERINHILKSEGLLGEDEAGNILGFRAPRRRVFHHATTGLPYPLHQATASIGPKFVEATRRLYVPFVSQEYQIDDAMIIWASGWKEKWSSFIEASSVVVAVSKKLPRVEEGSWASVLYAEPLGRTVAIDPQPKAVEAGREPLVGEGNTSVSEVLSKSLEMREVWPGCAERLGTRGMTLESDRGLQSETLFSVLPPSTSGGTMNNGTYRIVGPAIGAEYADVQLALITRFVKSPPRHDSFSVVYGGTEGDAFEERRTYLSSHVRLDNVVLRRGGAD